MITIKLPIVIFKKRFDSVMVSIIFNRFIINFENITTQSRKFNPPLNANIKEAVLDPDGLYIIAAIKYQKGHALIKNPIPITEVVFDFSIYSTSSQFLLTSTANALNDSN